MLSQEARKSQVVAKSGCSIGTERRGEGAKRESVAVHGTREQKEVISVHLQNKEEKQNGRQGGHFARCGSIIT